MATKTKHISILFIMSDGSHERANTVTGDSVADYLRRTFRNTIDAAERAEVIGAAVAIGTDLQLYTQAECIELAE